MGTMPIKSEFCKRVTQKLREIRIAAGYNCNKVRGETDIDINKIENNKSIKGRIRAFDTPEVLLLSLSNIPGCLRTCRKQYCEYHNMY